MRYLRLEGHPQEIAGSWERYREYLAGIRAHLVSEVFEFASAQWHYDPKHHRSLHDSWLQSVAISEEARQVPDGSRSLRIKIALNGPYHDGHTYLSYHGVKKYELRLSAKETSGSARGGHGDWMLDELTLSENGNLLHDIAWSSGATWIIECEHLTHHTTIPAVIESD